MNHYSGELRSVRIAVIDSGVRLDHPAFRKANINGFAVAETPDGKYEVINCGVDLCGHGTAISSIISAAAPEAEIDVYNVFGEDNYIDTERLLYLLNDIYDSAEKYDLINMSIGCYRDDAELMNICRELHRKNIIIVSAFDNAGAISFPAAYDFVIGVDCSDECIHRDDYIVVENSIVNVLAKGGVQRLAWNHPDYVINQGASFAAAHVTGLIANQLRVSGLSKSAHDIIYENAKRVLVQKRVEETLKRAEYFSHEDMKEAALYPFNKEMHNLLNMSDKLNFHIRYVIGSRYAMQRNYVDTRGRDHKICRVGDCRWDSIDTILIGHIDELENRIGGDEFNEIVNLCVENNIMMYIFDEYALSRIEKAGGGKARTYMPGTPFTGTPFSKKLYKLSTPVIGILGTTSQQGKFHLLLSLSEVFKANEYTVATLGTEPTSLLFGADEIYPYGYNSPLDAANAAHIHTVNSIMHKLDKLNRDVIIFNGQSGTCPMLYNNIDQLNLAQHNFLLGTMPDAVILCINSFDDTEYIIRTIKYVEGYFDTKVIALCLYPMDYKNGWYITNGIKTKLQDEEIRTAVLQFESAIGLPTFVNGNEYDTEEIFKLCVDFFSKE